MKTLQILNRSLISFKSTLHSFNLQCLDHLTFGLLGVKLSRLYAERHELQKERAGLSHFRNAYKGELKKMKEEVLRLEQKSVDLQTEFKARQRYFHICEQARVKAASDVQSLTQFTERSINVLLD